MESINDFDYENVEEILAEAEVETTASELQAAICGMIAAGLKPNDRGWRDTIFDLINDGREVPIEVKQVIEELAEWTDKNINEQDSLAPTLLPDDGYPAVDQLEAIAVWCQGFLLGFGLQTSNDSVENPEVREGLNDLAEISQLELEAEDNEETRHAIFSFIEHIRVVVQVIHWELVVKHQASANISPGNDTVH
ncbi:MAG: UPF0149 family protein [Kangiellaceae bacterium]|nr:UPF0149 family protein [Kangiellaceae bacterium]MCW8999851.1 UPF0149 family protein [Kangiellaceae bacterium]MCW9016627.1 UPF0149 family protein [Kangiellaceae bacterium]